MNFEDKLTNLMLSVAFLLSGFAIGMAVMHHQRPQPCAQTVTQKVYRLCFLDEKNGRWVK